MNAAFVLASLSRRGGGVAEAVRHLAQRLHAIPNAHIEVFGMRDDFTEADIADWRPVDVTACTVVGPRSFGYSPGLLEKVRETQPEILHCHGLWMYSSLVSLHVSFQGIPNIISPHGMLDPWALRHSAWKKRIASMLFERLHLRRACCLHALCIPELEAIRALGLVNPVCLVPNGVSLPPDAIGTLDRTVSTDVGPKTALYLGRLHPKKELHTLLDAWAEARRRRPVEAAPWRLQIAGWEGMPGYERVLRDKAVDLGLDGYVTFPGPLFRQSKETAFRRSSAFVLASISEGMPMAVLEAWAHGLPVVMTRECNLPDGFEAEAAIATNANANSLADALVQMFLMTDGERTAMGANGRRLVQRKYTWEQVATQFESVYEWMARGASRPDCVSL